MLGNGHPQLAPPDVYSTALSVSPASIAKALHDRRPMRLVRASRPALPMTTMTVPDFEFLCTQTFGRETWKGCFADLVGVEQSTVSRWCSGAQPIPKMVAVLVWALWVARMRGAFPVPTPDPSGDQFAWMDDTPPRAGRGRGMR